MGMYGTNCWAESVVESVVDCVAPVPAEFVAFLHGITRRSKRVVNKKILLGFLSKVNCMHMLVRLS